MSGFYVYVVTGRPDGLRFAFHRYDEPSKVSALFADAGDAWQYVQLLRDCGIAVDVLPTAEAELR